MLLQSLRLAWPSQTPWYGLGFISISPPRLFLLSCVNVLLYRFRCVSLCVVFVPVVLQLPAACLPALDFGLRQASVGCFVYDQKRTKRPVIQAASTSTNFTSSPGNFNSNSGSALPLTM